MITPLIHWPEGDVVKVDPANIVDASSPPGEKRYCYLTTKQKHGTMNIVIRVAGEASAVAAQLGVPHRRIT